MADDDKDARPLMKPATARTLGALGVALLALGLAADLLRERHGFFGFDAWFGFYPAFGFLGGLVTIGVAKAIGAVLKRPASHYDDRR